MRHLTGESTEPDDGWTYPALVVMLTWDSAERRELHVEGIKAGPDQAAAVSAWKQADVDQARHPREAVQGAKGKSSRARVPAATAEHQIGRDGR